MAMTLRSTAFQRGEMIPSEYTCDGENVSPPLTWGDVPEGTMSLALVMEDIDSVEGTWSHWVLYNLPPAVKALPEAVAPSETLIAGGSQGHNDFDELGYGGPCPSDGETHRYVVRLYALDAPLDLAPGAARAQVLERVEGHILEAVELLGRYRRLADR
jgi:hypothetical protein